MAAAGNSIGGNFPLDLMGNNLCFLDLGSFVSCSRVNREWRQLTEQDFYWEHLWKSSVAPRESIPKEVESVKMYMARHLTAHAVMTEDAFIERFRDFMGKVRAYERGELTCYFPFNPECSFHLQCGSEGPQEQRVLKESYFFMKPVHRAVSLYVQKEQKLLFDGVLFDSALFGPSSYEITASLPAISDNVGEMVGRCYGGLSHVAYQMREMGIIVEKEMITRNVFVKNNVLQIEEH